jgi:glycosyltransferase involved in cell wall biosynthesis
MRIALLGTRGVPANYGGFETFAEQLGQRLVERGHHVTVYCRSHHIQYSGAEYEGMRLVMLPTIANKYLDTFIHTFISSLHSLSQSYDVVFYCNVGNSPLTWIPRLSGVPTVLHVDGLDWTREKWPPLAKKYIQFGAYLATKLPNACVTDSRVVQRHYQERFGRRPLCIPYGSEVDLLPPGETLVRFGLEADRYLLFVGRLVPENCAHHLVDAFKGLETDLKCVIVGDAAYADGYISSLLASAQSDPRIVFTGYLFGDGYCELAANARISVITSAASGTHPALVEAMGFGNCVVVQDIEENLETVGDAGLSYEGQAGAAGLRGVLQRLLSDPRLVEEYRRRARTRAQEYFSWDAVTRSYERLFRRIARLPSPEDERQPGSPESR